MFGESTERAPGEFELITPAPEPGLVGSAVNVSARVLDRLRTKGWVRGKRAQGEKMCLLGAYAQELYGKPNGNISLGRVEVLREVIMEQYPGKYADSDPFVVTKFNDDLTVTWDEVEKVLEKAAAKEREHGD